MAATKKNLGDQFANIAAIGVTETAANTMTSAKFAFPFSIMDKMALLINRMEYWFEGFSALNSQEDNIVGCLTTASSVISINNQADPQIIDSCRLVRVDIGAAASGVLLGQPFIKDFSTLPGGGLLVAPSPLYAMIKGTGNAAVTGLQLKLFYTYMELSTDQYWELVESRRIISS
jgi:hypothetical protein